MAISFIEIRVWIRYPGQFSGQVPAQNRSIYILEDPGGRIASRIEAIVTVARRIQEFAEHSGFLSPIRHDWNVLVVRRHIAALLRILKRTLILAPVGSVDTEEAAIMLEHYEKLRLREDVDKSHRIEFFVLSIDSIEKFREAKYLASATINK